MNPVKILDLEIKLKVRNFFFKAMSMTKAYKFSSMPSYICQEHILKYSWVW